MKKLGFVFVVAGFILFCSNSISAQTSAEEITTKFFTILKDKGMDKAYDYLYADKKAVEENQDLIGNNKNMIIELTKSLGEYNGFDFISKDETAKSYVRYNYMLKYDKAPVKFMITFYKPKEAWKVYEVMGARQIDDKMPLIRQIPLKGLR